VREFIRLKLPGACVVELDPSIITILRVVYDEDIGAYSLLVGTDSSQYVIMKGDMDQVHFKLNELHDILDIQILDI